MAIDLASGLERTRLLLMDTRLPSTWQESDLQNALRMALGVVALYTGTPVSLAGLDGAGSTTLAERGEAVLVLGAAAFAALSRAARRAESYELAQTTPDLAEWGGSMLAEFHKQLSLLYPRDEEWQATQAHEAAALAAEALRRANLLAAQTAPWAAWEDPTWTSL